jgi:ribosomal-protein-alanine N-acetyltransferase
VTILPAPSFENVLVQNEHIYLRKLTLDDAEFILELTNEPGWLEQIGDKQIYSIKQAAHFIKSGPIQTYKRYGFGLYLIVLKRNSQPLGVCGLLKRSYLNAPDLGYAITQKAYRQGYAQMSCELVLTMVKDLNNVSYIYASTKPSNLASQNLLIKLGFVQEGALMSSSLDDNLLLFMKDIDVY